VADKKRIDIIFSSRIGRHAAGSGPRSGTPVASEAFFATVEADAERMAEEAAERVVSYYR
jgi:hypothetical protein